MKFSILVHGSAFDQQGVHSAYRFTKAALEGGHEVYRVFFYGDSVMVANDLISPPQDETHLPQAWNSLASEYDLDLVICIAAAVKRGVLNEVEAKRYEKTAANLIDNFDISGLGQLAEAISVSDRVLTFGA